MGNWAKFRVLILAAALSACSGGTATGPVPFVDLERREPLPPVVVTEVTPLRVAVAAVLSPEGNVESYADLAEYLAERLGRPAELVQRRTYAEVNDLIARGEVDLAFVCTSAYISGTERSEMKLLVVPEVKGESVYQSVVIVPAESTIDEIGDLKGKIFVFTDPSSYTGRAYPTFLVRQMGTTPESFFARTFFTYSHDRAIEAVADGLADGGAVDSLVLAYAMDRDPSLTERIRVIHRSPDFGIPPVVVPMGSSPRLEFELRELLLGLDRDPAGPEILARLGIDRFVVGDDAAYDGARELAEASGIGQ